MAVKYPLCASYRSLSGPYERVMKLIEKVPFFAVPNFAQNRQRGFNSKNEQSKAAKNQQFYCFLEISQLPACLIT